MQTRRHHPELQGSRREAAPDPAAMAECSGARETIIPVLAMEDAEPDAAEQGRGARGRVRGPFLRLLRHLPPRPAG